MEKRTKLLKEMDSLLWNLNSDWAYKEWWNCMYKDIKPKYSDTWDKIAADNDSFLILTTKFLVIMSQYVLSNLL